MAAAVSRQRYAVRSARIGEIDAARPAVNTGADRDYRSA
jgi:hypothetical protein